MNGTPPPGTAVVGNRVAVIAGVLAALGSWIAAVATTEMLGASLYFFDSRSPWQRGTNENTNRLLRDYFPKGVILASHQPAHLMAVEHELNHRPRLILQDRCPAHLFAALLASERPSAFRR